MLPYLHLIRPLCCLVAVALFWTGFLLAGSPAVPLGMDFLFGAGAAFFIAAGAMAANDIFDIELDRHNKPKRPLPSGRITKKKAWACAAIFLIIGNFFGAVLGREEFYITLIISIFLLVHFWKLKKIVYAGFVFSSITLVLFMLFGGFASGSVLPAIWASIILALSNIGREIFKSIDDTLGEKKASLDNIALRLGIFRAKLAASCFTLAGIVSTFVPYTLGMADEVYLFFAIIADILLITSIGAPVKYSSKTSKAAIALIIMALILGSPQIQAIILA
jgi:geranylgeranylglycerol-phosphate geranylgeranyltransferase